MLYVSSSSTMKNTMEKQHNYITIVHKDMLQDSFNKDGHASYMENTPFLSLALILLLWSSYKDSWQVVHAHATHSMCIYYTQNVFHYKVQKCILCFG